MSFLDKLFAKTKKKSISLITNGNTFAGFEHTTDRANLNSYKESLYLYIAVSKITKRGAGVPLELYRVKNKRGDVVEVMDHSLLQLFNSPNPFMTKREFFELSLAHYLLAGDCFWLIERRGAAIVGLTPLRPDYVQIVLNNDATSIVAYEYTNVTVSRFKPEDIIHVKNIDPTNWVRGTGPGRPATIRVLTEKEATKYQANFFKNQGRPDIVILAEGEVSTEAADEARADWKRVFGSNEGGKLGVFGGNVKDVKELNKTPKEMDFIESQHFLRDDILAAFGVPKAMVTSDDVNLANAKEAYRMFLQEAVIPALDTFIDVINNRLVPQVDVAVFFDFTDPTPLDREMLLKEATELKKAGVITANEARALFNYESMEDADTLSMAQNSPATAQETAELQSKAKDVIRSRPLLAKRLTAIEKTVDLVMLTQPKRSMNSIFATKEMKQSYAKAVNDRADRKAEVLKAALDEFHDGLLTRILATDLQPDSFIDLQAEKIAAKNAFTPLVVKIYKEGGQEALDALFRKSTDQFFTDEQMIAAMQARAAFFTESMMDTTYEVLRGKIVTGIGNGDGVDKIANSLRDYFKDMGVKRSLTIARTETGYALSKATNDAYNQSSVVTGKEWINVGDDDVRHDHKDTAIGGLNGGVIVAKGGAFPNGEHYPGEQSINCRCVLAAAV